MVLSIRVAAVFPRPPSGQSPATLIALFPWDIFFRKSGRLPPPPGESILPQNHKKTGKKQEESDIFQGTWKLFFR